MLILGIDPGIARIGYGIVKDEKGNLIPISYGCIITSPQTIFPLRLKKIYEEILKIIKEFKPEIVVIEKLFFAKNIKTAISISQAQGVIILASIMSGISIKEYTPLEVKQSVTGFGKADKKQVQVMIKHILKLKEIPKLDDTADALALAICYLNFAKFEKQIKNKLNT
ncbi:MAG: crossover junction endodeoxyribonuclease RuvC [bacterium]